MKMKKLIATVIFASIIFTGCEEDNYVEKNSSNVSAEFSGIEETKTSLSEITTELEAEDESVNNPEMDMKYSNIAGNNINSGIVAQQDGWLYCNAGADLYRVEMSDTNFNFELLISDSPKYINVSDGWIYYTDRGKIYRYKIGQIEKEVLYTSETDFKFMAVVGERIYFTEMVINTGDVIYNYNIYKMRTDGSKLTKLNEKYCGKIINIVDGYIYYCYSDYPAYPDSGKLFRKPLDGGEAEFITDKCIIMQVVGDWVYYINFADGNKLYRVNVDGKNDMKVNDDKSWYFNVKDGWIYYVNTADLDKLYKIRVDGTEKVKLNDIESASVNILDDWIYYNADYEPGFGYDLYRIKFDGTENTLLWRNEYKDFDPNSPNN